MKSLWKALKALPLTLAWACAPSHLTGQARPDSVQHRNNCRRAEQVIASGHPSPHESWALAVVGGCKDAGPTLATALSGARSSADTAYLNALTAPLIGLRDRHVFTAALALAGDRTATQPARVAAIRVLMYAVRPGGYVDPSALPNRETRYCFESRPVHFTLVAGAPLPPSHVADVRMLVSRLARDASEPEGIRNAANCAMYSVQDM